MNVNICVLTARPVILKFPDITHTIVMIPCAPAAEGEA